MQPQPQPPSRPVTVSYEVPPHASAAERHGPFRLTRDANSGGDGVVVVHITGEYRAVWGAWRSAILAVAAAGVLLFAAGMVADAVRGRPLMIDLRQMPPRVVGSPAAAIGLGLLAAALAAWAAFRIATWRHVHRLEIDASPHELIVRQLLPTGQQVAGRWNPADVESVTHAQYQLMIRSRTRPPLQLVVGGPWTAPAWLAQRMGEAMNPPAERMGPRADQRTNAAG